MSNSFNSRSQLDVNGTQYEIYDISLIPGTDKLPYSLKILLENLLRHEDGVSVTVDDIQKLSHWSPKSTTEQEIAFTPARILMQDFTGVPAVVDLAAMRDAMKSLGGDPDKINPLQAAELVIDHSVQVDKAGSADAFEFNATLEFQRNHERYSFLKWGQHAFSNFKVVPPDTGIVHQINLEYLARVVFERTQNGVSQAYPDTLIGTDSHTTMINGLGVLGWGVGGIEAEAAMLGQPVSMLVPKVVGFKITGELVEGTTATDLVLTIVEQLRAHGVVGKFVEFYGDGLDHLPLADQATIANMAPEYGATCGIFPIDQDTLDYMALTGRSQQQIDLTEAYAKKLGMFRYSGKPEADYNEYITLDISSIEPAIAGPKRPQDRISLNKAKAVFAKHYQEMTGKDLEQKLSRTINLNGQNVELNDASIVIASITSCTNTSNPSVMIGAGLVARKAAELGLTVKPWVKTSLAPGSRVVTEYLMASKLMQPLEALGFHNIGYGCATCIGNSGPLAEPISNAIQENHLTVCSVLSGNRNFEGRVHAEVKMNFLASPPLVVAYALAGTMDIDLFNEPLGQSTEGKDIFLKDLWPSRKEVDQLVQEHVTRDQYVSSYKDIYSGESQWANLESPAGQLYAWQENSTYVRNPPYFEGMTLTPDKVTDITNARVLAVLGDSVTTDHISPAGAIKADSPAGIYLQEQGIAATDFNSYGSRRGNHEVMMRGTFANIRLRNLLAPGTEGGFSLYLPDNEVMPLYDAAMKYQKDNIALIILAGKEYGSGSSRDWAAKGPRLLGVRAVIAESYERIHRTNLVCMGILPLQFEQGQSAKSLGLSGHEVFSIKGLDEGRAKHVTVHVEGDDVREFTARVRIDTPKEIDYYQHGGILHYVLRQLATA